jgi:hypothetical protein
MQFPFLDPIGFVSITATIRADWQAGVSVNVPAIHLSLPHPSPLNMAAVGLNPLIIGAVQLAQFTLGTWSILKNCSIIIPQIEQMNSYVGIVTP